MNPLILLALAAGGFYYYDKQRKAKKPKPVTTTTVNGIVLHEVDGTDIKLDMSGVTDEQFMNVMSDLQRLVSDIAQSKGMNPEQMTVADQNEIAGEAFLALLRGYFPTLEVPPTNPDFFVLVKDDGGNILSLRLEDLTQGPALGMFAATT